MASTARLRSASTKASACITRLTVRLALLRRGRLAFAVPAPLAPAGPTSRNSGIATSPPPSPNG